MTTSASKASISVSTASQSETFGLGAALEDADLAAFFLAFPFRPRNIRTIG